jgi:hypothetical protein
MKLLRVGVILTLFVVTTVDVACGGSAGSSCSIAGGTCVLGGSPCSEQAPDADQDCNPDENPGGAFCCLKPSPDGGL